LPGGSHWIGGLGSINRKVEANDYFTTRENQASHIKGRSGVVLQTKLIELHGEATRENGLKEKYA